MWEIGPERQSRVQIERGIGIGRNAPLHAEPIPQDDSESQIRRWSAHPPKFHTPLKPTNSSKTKHLVVRMRRSDPYRSCQWSRSWLTRRVSGHRSTISKPISKIAVDHRLTNPSHFPCPVGQSQFTTEQRPRHGLRLG